jgi:hypothetical protein
MSILTPTEIRGTVAWLGIVAGDKDDIQSVEIEEAVIGWGGIEGDRHTGLTRPSCVRVRRQYPDGTEISNVRQLSILSAEELDEIAGLLDIPVVRPEWVGASMILKGIPDFTLIPPASRLIFDSGVSLTVDTENAPCRFPADVIEANHPGHGRAFPKLARHKRGVTAWVERPGRIEIGEAVRLHVPPQRLYPHV